MEYHNFFKDKIIKFLIIPFVIFSIFNIIYATISFKVFSVDGWFFFVDQALQSLSRDQLAWALPQRFRFFVTFVNAIPINIAHYLFGVTSKYCLAILWGVPIFLFPALCPLFNYILSKRSKRYDYVVFSLIIFSLLVLPTQVWPMVETMLAVSLIFILFHYLVSEIDYKWYDIFFIIFLTIVSFSASESNSYIGILLFIVALFYAKKTEKIKEKIVKYFIGFAGIIMPFVYTYFTIYLTKNEHMDNAYRFFVQELIHKYTPWSQCYKEPYLFLFVFILFSIFIIIFRNRNMKKVVFSISALCFFIFCSLLIFKKYFYGVYVFEYRVLLYIVPFLLLILIFLIDVYKEKISIDNLNNIFLNVLIVTLFMGIMNNIVGIFNSILFDNSIEKIEEKMRNSKSKIVLMNDIDLPPNMILPDHYSYVSIAISEKKTISKILVHDMYKKAFKIVNDEEKRIKILYPLAPIIVKTEFWDLEPIKKEIENYATKNKKKKK